MFVKARGQLRPLHVNAEKRSATFHLLQSIDEPSYRVNCMLDGDLWKCPSLKNWSTQILEEAFYNNDDLKEVFGFDNFGDGFPADDAGKISKLFGQPGYGILIEAGQLGTGYKVSAKCVTLPDCFSTRPRKEVVSASVKMSYQQSMVAKIHPSSANVRPAETRILTIKTVSDGVVEEMKIYRNILGEHSVSCQL
eukprot:GHVS01073959.1.p1 GENE.GHVS01073959.1~~GHVS01073959.1.p1  ORF type:complete len:194 (+),score=3.59 GHVS01073959.1:707-1288(+)